MADRHRIDGQFDVAERLFARLHAFDEVAVDAARAFVARDRLGLALLRPACLPPASSPCRACCGDRDAVGILEVQVLACLLIVEDRPLRAAVRGRRRRTSHRRSDGHPSRSCRRRSSRCRTASCRRWWRSCRRSACGCRVPRRGPSHMSQSMSSGTSSAGRLQAATADRR